MSCCECQIQNNIQSEGKNLANSSYAIQQCTQKHNLGWINFIDKTTNGLFPPSREWFQVYVNFYAIQKSHLDRVKRIWYLLPMQAAKVQASLRIRAVSPEPPLLAHRSSESRGTLRHKARSLAPLNGWACAVKICHDGMLEDTNSLGGAHLKELEQNQIHTQRH